MNTPIPTRALVPSWRARGWPVLIKIAVGLVALLSLTVTLLYVEASFGHDGLLCEMGYAVKPNADHCG